MPRSSLAEIAVGELISTLQGRGYELRTYPTDRPYSSAGSRILHGQGGDCVGIRIISSSDLRIVYAKDKKAASFDVSITDPHWIELVLETIDDAILV